MSHEELLNELAAYRDLGDAPVGEHWAVLVKKSVIAAALEAVERLVELEKTGPGA